jgi:U3 small nucleolar RNA-associated protein 14
MIRFTEHIIEVKKLFKSTPKFIKVSSSEQKFIKIALDGEEDQIPSIDLSNLVDNSSEKIDSITNHIWSLVQDFENQLVHGNPDYDNNMESQEFSNHFLNKLSNPDKMNPIEYMDFLQLVPMGRRVIYDEVQRLYGSVSKENRLESQALNQAMNLQEIYLRMHYLNTNPFNYDDIRNVVSEIVTNNFSGRF